MVETTQTVVDNKVICRGRITSFGRDRDGRRVVEIYIRQGFQAPPISLEFLYRSMNDDVEVGDFVEIEGYIRSGYIRTTESQRYPTYTQSFVMEKITKLNTEIKNVFGVDGGFSYGQMFFRAYYEGTVTRVEQTTGSTKDANGNSRDTTFTRVLVRTKAKGFDPRSNLISAQFTNRMRVADNKIKVGDKVVVIANLSTRSKRNSNNELVTYRNLIIDDLVITEVAPESSTKDDSSNKIQTQEEAGVDKVSPEQPVSNDVADSKVADENVSNIETHTEKPDLSTQEGKGGLKVVDEDDEGEDLF